MPHKRKQNRGQPTRIPSQPTGAPQQPDSAPEGIHIPTNQELDSLVSQAMSLAEEVEMTVGERMAVLDHYFGNVFVSQQHYLLSLHQQVNAYGRAVYELAGMKTTPEMGEIDIDAALDDFTRALMGERIKSDIAFCEVKAKQVGRQPKLFVPDARQASLLTP